MSFKSDAANEEKVAVTVKEVMRVPVTVLENETIFNVAKLMDKHNIGSIVIVNAKRKPVGIITERDVVRRVVAKGRSTSTECQEIMSHPLATVPPDAGVNEAALRMAQLGVRRLVVMIGEKIAGMISATEIVRITPSLIEAVLERSKVGMILPLGVKSPLAGYCESCGQWTELLTEISGKFVCDECAIESGEAEETVE